jgi:putative protein-disulfide isomerase
MQPKDVKSLQLNNTRNSGETVGMEITFYTDPLCCWTWAMQSQWKKLLNDDLQRLHPVVKYKMGGLLPSWKHFYDSTNSIRKPVQMGPEWMHARAISGAVINDRIWITDPPASSFPACIAVKCTEFQSPSIAEHFLNLLQEAVMVKNMNISKSDIILEVASALPTAFPDFDFGKFKEDLFGERAKDAFRKDLHEYKYLNIIRMPTILFKASNRRSVLASGYQTYESLKNVCIKMEDGYPEP